MKTMLLLPLALVALATVALAASSGAPENSGQPGDDFLARQQEVLGQLNRRINHLSVLPKMYATTQQILELQKTQRCVGNSQSHPAMKNCLDQAHSHNALPNSRSAM